jgi:hypothetical protein
MTKPAVTACWSAACCAGDSANNRAVPHAPIPTADVTTMRTIRSRTVAAAASARMRNCNMPTIMTVLARGAPEQGYSTLRPRLGNRKAATVAPACCADHRRSRTAGAPLGLASQCTARQMDSATPVPCRRTLPGYPECPNRRAQHRLGIGVRRTNARPAVCVFFMRWPA